MEAPKPYLAPDPLTEPEKCAGLRNSFTIIAVLGVAIFAIAVLALCSPRFYSWVQSSVDLVLVSPDDPSPLEHTSVQPILH